MYLKHSSTAEWTLERPRAFLIQDHTPRKEARKGFCCGSVCETMEDYKEGYLMVWAGYYMSPCNSIVGLYFEGTLRVTSYQLPW